MCSGQHNSKGALSMQFVDSVDSGGETLRVARANSIKIFGGYE